MKFLRMNAVLSLILVFGIICTACGRSTTPAADKPDTEKAKPEAVQGAAETEVQTSAAEAPAWLGEFFGDKLVKADGSEVSPNELAGKTVGIYFSAHWCPPCRGFTPVLVKTYNELAAAGKPFELVFVSSDQTEGKMFNYMTETKMPWKALPFGSDKKDFLAGKYGVRGIPTLVIVDKDGKTISKTARGDVVSKGAAALDGWK